MEIKTGTIEKHHEERRAMIKRSINDNFQPNKQSLYDLSTATGRAASTVTGRCSRWDESAPVLPPLLKTTGVLAMGTTDEYYPTWDGSSSVFLLFSAMKALPVPAFTKGQGSKGFLTSIV